MQRLAGWREATSSCSPTNSQLNSYNSYAVCTDHENLSLLTTNLPCICSSQPKMKWAFSFTLLLLVMSLTSGHDSSEEGEDEVVTFTSPQNESLRSDMEKVMERLDFLEKAARQGFIYNQNRLDAMEEQVELNKNSLSTTETVTSNTLLCETLPPEIKISSL